MTVLHFHDILSSFPLIIISPFFHFHPHSFLLSSRLHIHPHPPLPSVPEAPARVKAVVSGPRAAVVSWAPPLRPRGRITRYTVHWASAGSRSMPHTRRVGPHVTHLTLHDLPHTTHEVRILSL